MEIWDKISTSGRGRHTLRVNEPGPGDVLLRVEKLRKGDKFMSTVDHTFRYSAKNNEQITAVVAEDQWSDDTGGDAEVTHGGVGCSSVEVKVISRFSRGFHFHFYVFGKKN